MSRRKIYRKVVIDIHTGSTLYEDSYLYEGPLDLCQQNQQFIYDPASGAWVFNPVSVLTPPAPLVTVQGKQLTVENSLTFKGIDNQTIDTSNLPQGNLALGSAALAAASSFQPAGAAAGLSSVASDSLTIGTGSVTFNTSTGLAYATNMVVTAYYTSDATIFMQGAVTSYDTNTGVLILNVTNTGGSGPYTSWTISISGPQGATGPTGPAGEPSGTIVAFGGSTAPAGYLPCDGAPVSRTTYSALFSAIGTTWGVGDGTTTFNVPDLRGRFPLGMGQGNTAQGGGAGTNRVLGVKSNGASSGATAGAETHLLTITEMPSHNHGSATSGQSANHTHNVTGYQDLSGTEIQGSGVSTSGGTAHATSGFSNDHVHYVSAQGGGAVHTVMSPFGVVNYIIKT